MAIEPVTGIAWARTLSVTTHHRDTIRRVARMSDPFKTDGEINEQIRRYARHATPERPEATDGWSGNAEAYGVEETEDYMDALETQIADLKAENTRLQQTVAELCGYESVEEMNAEEALHE
jgi:hypothetical protein